MPKCSQLNFRKVRRASKAPPPPVWIGLNTLSSYCKTWTLKVNPKKTKILIFQKRPRKSVEIVQEYTYLGTRLTPTGNFTLAVEHLKEKALHAFSSIRKHTLLTRLNPNNASQIFDTMIFPILSYNSEVWAMYTKQNFKTRDSSPIAKIHLKFCKHYLEVNNMASNVACRAELGKLPLIIPINQKIMSKNLHFINNSGFYSNFMNLIEQYHLSNLDPESLDNDRIRRSGIRNPWIWLAVDARSAGPVFSYPDRFCYGNRAN